MFCRVATIFGQGAACDSRRLHTKPCEAGGLGLATGQVGLVVYGAFGIIARGKHQTAHCALRTGFMAPGMMIPGIWSGWLQEITGCQRFFARVALIPLEREFGRRG